jgi:hypothetical protein
MAYPVPLSSVLEYVIRLTVDGQECMSVLHYQYDSGSSIADGKAALTDFLNKMRVAGELNDKYRGCIPDEVTDITYRAQWITPQRFRYTFLAVAPEAGLVAAPTMPSAVSVAITKQAEAANRHGQGTLHMPAVPQSFVTDSMVNGLGGLAYLDLCTKLILPIVLTGGQLMNPVLFRRDDPVLSETIITAFPQATTRVNRRRTVGLGS